MFVHRAVFAVLFAIAPAAFATGPRVFVASNGTDAGLCARSAPCRTFAFAITQVSPGGELVALDTAGYGPVTITMSVSIYAAPGQVAAIIGGPPDPDITINATANDIVTIRGLYLTSAGAHNGIAFNSGKVLQVADTVFTNFSQDNAALDIRRMGATDAANVFVSNCAFLNSYQGVIALNPTEGGVVRLSIRNSRFENMAVTGIEVTDNVHATVTDSAFLATGQGTAIGVQPGTATGDSEVNLERCTIQSFNVAFQAGGAANAVIRVAYSLLIDNFFATGLVTNGSVLSRLDGTSPTNTIEGSAFTTLSGTYSAK
jgi:parallel beta helix pectate lyase-like protein